MMGADMSFKPGGAHEPYLDALACFENSYFSKPFKEKYGVTFRYFIRRGMDIAHRATEKSRAETATEGHDHV